MNKLNTINKELISLDILYSECVENIDYIPLVLSKKGVNIIEIEDNEYITYKDYILIKETLELKRPCGEITINKSDNLIEFDIF